MDEEKKKKCAAVITCVFCIPILAGVACIIAYLIITSVKTCQALCGDQYKIDDIYGNCCMSPNSGCVKKSSCDNMDTLFNVGIYMTGISVLVCCYCIGIFGPRTRQSTDYVTVAPQKQKRYIHAIIQVED